MLRKFWRWLVGEDMNQQRLMATFDIMISQQQKTSQAMMSAMQSMAQAGEKQAEMIGNYLKLFQTPGEPQRWEHDPQAENEKEILDLGFPSEGTEAEQAQWILDNIDRM